MRLYHIEDTRHVDAFNIPSIFADRLMFYKEWHDFVFYDRTQRIFGLLNFGVHGNPYDAKRGYGTVLSYFVDPQGRIFTEQKLIPLHQLHVSAYNPDYIGEDITVKYQDDDSFTIQGNLDTIAFDLNLPVELPPNTNIGIVLDVLQLHQQVSRGMILAAEEMARLWDNWVELPRLFSLGDVTLEGTTFPINTRTGYHDHEGGRFDWSSPFGWDTGVILCDPEHKDEPLNVRFLFYRYGPFTQSAYGGVIFETKQGIRKYFDSEKLDVATISRFSGEQRIVPGITRLLYPDYQPHVPQRIRYSTVDGSDTLDIVFTPKAVCSVIAASLVNTAEMELNEIFCNADIKGIVAGTEYDVTIPCWFESARPRGSVKYYADDV